jgi:TRAP-type mannitol/chloroaromatic compound transport system substrate-binding protein
MQRRAFLKVATVGAAAGAIASPAIAQAQPELKWRLTSAFPKSLDTLFGVSEYFSKRVAEITDNRFQIQLFAAGEIVPGLQAGDAAGAGTVEMAHVPIYYYVGKDPAFAFGTSLPFGPNARMQRAWFMHGGGNELFNAFVRNHNLHHLPAGNTGAQMGGWFRKEINTLDDMRGLKFRISGLAGRILQKVGVVPQQIAAGDIYPALERGTIDAAEWVGPHDDEKLGFVRVARNYYYPGWWEGGAEVGLAINLQKWEALPKAYQAAIQAATGEAAGWMLGKYDANNAAALKRLVSAGAQLKGFPVPVLEACWNAANELYAEISAQNPAFKAMYESLKAFRSDQYLWAQVAEYSYDSFQIRMRTRG